jgi:hypothetical protein
MPRLAAIFRMDQPVELVLNRVKRKIQYAKAQLRAKVEYPFQVTEIRFNHCNVGDHGLEKTAVRLTLVCYEKTTSA